MRASLLKVEEFLVIPSIKNGYLTLCIKTKINKNVYLYKTELNIEDFHDLSVYFTKFETIEEVLDDLHYRFQNNLIKLTNKGQHLHLDYNIKVQNQNVLIPLIKCEYEPYEDRNKFLNEEYYLNERNRINDNYNNNLNDQFNNENELMKEEILKLKNEVSLVNQTNNELIMNQNNLIQKINTLENELGHVYTNKNDINNIPININSLFPEQVLRISNIFQNREDLQLIENKINKGPLNYALLFRATEDGDSAKIFHDKCDNALNTLIVIRTNEGKRFGGYTTQSWEGNNIYKKDEEAFVFSLNKNKIYPVNEDKNAIWCFRNWGPIFEGYQIDIKDNFFNQLNKTGLKGIGFKTEEDFELNDGQENFIINELEIYQVGN